MHCFIIAAITVDGFIAQQVDQVSTAWTSSQDKAWFNQRTKQAGVIVMGSNTFQTVGRALPGRRTIVLSSKPTVSDISAVEFRTGSPTEILDQLASEGVTEVAICGGSAVYTAYLQAGVVETLYLTVEPVVFGTGISLFNQPLNQKLQLVAIHDLSDQTKVFEYRTTSASHQS